MSDQTDVLQGTLDLLIMRTIAPAPLHGWAIAQRIEQISDELLRVQQGSLYPRCTASSIRDGSPRNGAPRTITAGRASIRSPGRGASSS